MATATSEYVSWLDAIGVPLFEVDGLMWQRYLHALIPADITVDFQDASSSDMQRAAKRARSLFARWSSGPVPNPTNWWHVSCSQFDFAELSSNMRNQVRRGLKCNTVRQLTSSWMANNGYECFLRAHDRYEGIQPVSQEVFSFNFHRQGSGPFEHWGVFSDESLTGYVSIAVETDRSAIAVMKLDPASMKDYTTYALLNTVTEHYVKERGLRLGNGPRSILHDTQVQDFLLKFGFERNYGKLEIEYTGLGRGALALAKLAQPVRRLLPLQPRSQSSALVRQHSIHRAGSSSADFTPVG